jgi:HD-GYP domain-containing protein (c-di-GMP phosphodiesterase class II)
VSVADVFDALTTNRAYRAAMTFDQAWTVLDDEVEKGRLDVDATAALKEVVKVSGIRRDPAESGSVSGLFR